MGKKIDRTGKVCVECRWCEWQVDFDHGSRRVCAKTGEVQSVGAVLHKPACADFEPPPSSLYWGP
jgi:hypothetical protein